MMENHAVYILASKRHRTLYIGKTSDLPRRISEHKSGLIGSFTQRYNVKNLVYYESHNDHWDAAKREARLKKWKRGRKIELIEESNSDWNDLYVDLF